MGVSTSTIVKFFKEENQLVNTYYLEDRSDDYIYDGLAASGGATFTPEQKSIMKVYFAAESGSVMEGYAEVTPNIQDPAKLIPIWEKIRGHAIKELHNKTTNYHNNLFDFHTKLEEQVSRYNQIKQGMFSKKEAFQLPSEIKLQTKDAFKRNVWDATWKIDSISKIIGLLIVAKAEKYKVEITASDF